MHRLILIVLAVLILSVTASAQTFFPWAGGNNPFANYTPPDSGKRFVLGATYEAPYGYRMIIIGSVATASGERVWIGEMIRSSGAPPVGALLSFPANADAQPWTLASSPTTGASAPTTNLSVPPAAYEDPLAFLTVLLTRTDLTADQLERINNAIQFERGVIGTERSGLSLRRLF